MSKNFGIEEVDNGYIISISDTARITKRVCTDMDELLYAVILHFQGMNAAHEFRRITTKTAGAGG